MAFDIMKAEKSKS